MPINCCWLNGKVSVHRHYGAEAIVDHLKKRGHAKNGWWGIGTAMCIVIVHDLSATIYTISGDGKHPTFPLIAASIGMCCLCFVPFLMSRMMRALHEGVADEREERHQGRLRRIEQRQEIKALKQRGPLLVPLERLDAQALESEVADNGAAPFRPQQAGHS